MLTYGAIGAGASGVDTRLFMPILDKITDQTQLDKEVFSLVGFWLQQQVFLT